MGVDSKRWSLDPAGSEAGGLRRRWGRTPRLVCESLGGTATRPSSEEFRTAVSVRLGFGRGAARLDTTRRQAQSARAPRRVALKVPPCSFLQMATLPSLEGLMTPEWGPHGFGPRVAGSGQQQGPKLVGSSTSPGVAAQGSSVSLSADGNTAIVGGPADGFGDLAMELLEPHGFGRGAAACGRNKEPNLSARALGSSRQGESVSLSADGNTAIVGGPSDGVGTGATWVWRRSGGVWTQGPKLVGSGGSGMSNQGQSVSLSADGLVTAVTGGVFDNGGAGAAWVFADSANLNWTLKSPTFRPTPRFLHSIAYDAERRQVVLFGGLDRPGGIWLTIPGCGMGRTGSREARRTVQRHANRP